MGGEDRNMNHELSGPQENQGDADRASEDMACCIRPMISLPGADEQSDPSWKHYPNTILCFNEPKFEVDLRQQVSKDDAELLGSLFGPQPFCVITADNPHGQLTDEEANRRQRARLGRMIEALEAKSIGCVGRSPNRLHSEAGLAVAVPKEVGKYLAVKFGQTAFFYYDTRRFWLEPAIVDAERCPLPTLEHLLPSPVRSNIAETPDRIW